MALVIALGSLAWASHDEQAPQREHRPRLNPGPQLRSMRRIVAEQPFL